MGEGCQVWQIMVIKNEAGVSSKTVSQEQLRENKGKKDGQTNKQKTLHLYFFLSTISDARDKLLFMVTFAFV